MLERTVAPPSTDVPNFQKSLTIFAHGTRSDDQQSTDRVAPPEACLGSIPEERTWTFPSLRKQKEGEHGPHQAAVSSSGSGSSGAFS